MNSPYAKQLRTLADELEKLVGQMPKPVRRTSTYIDASPVPADNVERLKQLSRLVSRYAVYAGRIVDQATRDGYCTDDIRSAVKAASESCSQEDSESSHLEAIFHRLMGVVCSRYGTAPKDFGDWRHRTVIPQELRQTFYVLRQAWDLGQIGEIGFVYASAMRELADILSSCQPQGSPSEARTEADLSQLQKLTLEVLRASTIPMTPAEISVAILGMDKQDSIHNPDSLRTSVLPALLKSGFIESLKRGKYQACPTENR